jgi:hypothetical protein
MSGFCGTGSFALDRAGGLTAAGMGANFNAGVIRSRSVDFAGAPSSPALFFAAVDFSVFDGNTGTLEPITPPGAM